MELLLGLFGISVAIGVVGGLSWRAIESYLEKRQEEDKTS